MKSIVLASVLVSLLACQSEGKKEPTRKAAAPREAVVPAEAVVPREAGGGESESELPKTALEVDLDRICNAEELSGALEMPSGDRALHTGIWLAKTIETQEARDFVAELTKLESVARIEVLQAKLAEHKISHCEIVNTWGGAQ
jgi:hypothetical protein